MKKSIKFYFLTFNAKRAVCAVAVDGRNVYSVEEVGHDYVKAIPIERAEAVTLLRAADRVDRARFPITYLGTFDPAKN